MTCGGTSRCRDAMASLAQRIDTLTAEEISEELSCMLLEVPLTEAWRTVVKAAIKQIDSICGPAHQR
jgi:hypothetical protein